MRDWIIESNWIRVDTKHRHPTTKSTCRCFVLARCQCMFAELCTNSRHIHIHMSKCPFFFYLYLHVRVKGIKFCPNQQTTKKSKGTGTKRERPKIDISCLFLIKNLRRVKLISIWAPPNWQMNWYRKLNWALMRNALDVDVAMFRTWKMECPTLHVRLLTAEGPFVRISGGSNRAFSRAHIGKMGGFHGTLVAEIKVDVWWQPWTAVITCPPNASASGGFHRIHRFPDPS